MLISTQKGVGGQEFKWYKNEVHNRGAKVPFKSVVGSQPPPLPPGMKNTVCCYNVYFFLYFYNEKTISSMAMLIHVEKI